MSAQTGSGVPSNYVVQVCRFGWISLAQLVRAPSHSRRAGAARRCARHSLWLTASIGAAIIVLMYLLDATEIGWMPPRGTGWLWPVRILTEFGKSKYVLWALAALLLVTALLFPRARGTPRSVLVGFGTRILFIFFAVLLPVLAGEVLKEVVGRGRPFVGGAANAFNFSHFSGSEAYASFPSGHATTAFALAFAVSAVWPHLRSVMLIYAVIIAATRLVLLAHHPSDVVAGALVGVIGAMFVRYWFAARHLAFTIRRDGAIEPLAGPSLGHLKRVARGAFAP
ncbi:phosphatase PAP2 family protein [Bradyrhizobium sp.]|jgi:undecaprenyl-diphosphatase|uniref:phosphatase PAP2 family protein n=1 Tax=Bradyrhizobium sp. TaxID=376 RepID=UPI002E03BB22|nr:phosphatase PAP2 family protein [Bradyrhizobium sp.]